MTEHLQTEFDGKIVWIVGASGTIGSATARHLSLHGAYTAVSGRQSNKLEALAHDCGGPTQSVPLDITSDASVSEAAKAIEEHWGQIDLLVVTVAVSAFGEFLELDSSAFHSAMETKYMGSLRCMRAVLPAMAKRRFGRIVVLSGGGGTNPRPVHLPGGGANAALELVSRGLAMRFANDGIRINIVAPGPISSPRMDEIAAASTKIGMDESHRPVGTPENVAEAIAYLLSPRSEFINGAVLRMDGGISR